MGSLRVKNGGEPGAAAQLKSGYRLFGYKKAVWDIIGMAEEGE